MAKLFQHPNGSFVCDTLDFEIEPGTQNSVSAGTFREPGARIDTLREPDHFILNVPLSVPQFLPGTIFFAEDAGVRYELLASDLRPSSRSFEVTGVVQSRK